MGNINIKNSRFYHYAPKEVVESIKQYKSISEMLNHVHVEYANDIAIVDGNNKYTFAQMNVLINSVRHLLKQEGVRKKQNVAVFFKSGVEFIVSSLAIMSYGAVAVLLPYDMNVTDLRYLINKYDVRAILTLSQDKYKFDDINIHWTKIIEYDKPRQSISLDVKKVKSWNNAAIVFTSGTIKKPKGVLLTNKNLMTGVFYGCLGYPNVFKQKYFLAIPLSHIFGFVRNMLTSYATGSCLYICHNLKNIFKEMMLFNPTILVTVPALAEMGLNAYKSFRKSLFGNQLQSIICGSASVPPYLIKEYKKININVYPGYGMTETSNLVSGNPEFEKKPQSVGFIYDGQTYKIVNGELWLKGNNIFKKYYGDYAETRATFKHGYLKTGDLARVDKDGFLYILGRTNDVIVLSSGIKIHPADIEAQFNALDCVQDSLIYQQKSETEASQLILEVVPRKMFLTENKIKNAYDYCINELCKVNSNLPTEKQVNKFVIRNLDFDRSPSIKIKKPRVISVDQQKIINKLTKIISKDLKKSIKNINLRLETRLRDEVGLSSINMLYLVIIIEDTFNIKFKNVGVSYFTTVYDIVKYIEERIPKNGRNSNNKK